MCRSLWPQTDCGYGAYCNETINVCICKEGFTSEGHLQLDSGRHCNLPVSLVRNMWLLTLILYSLLLLLRICGFCYDYRSKKKILHSKTRQTREKVLLLGLAADITMWVFAFISYSRPEILTGRNLYMTLLSSSNGMLWYPWIGSGIIYIHDVGLKLCKIHQDEIEQQESTLKLMVLTKYAYIVIIINYAIVPVFGVYIFGAKSSSLFITWHCAALALFDIITYISFVKGAIPNLVREIDTVIETAIYADKIQENFVYLSRVTALKRNALIVQVQASRFMILNLLTNVAIASVPVLKSYFPILLAVEVIMAGFASVFALDLLYNPGRLHKASRRVVPLEGKSIITNDSETESTRNTDQQLSVRTNTKDDA